MLVQHDCIESQTIRQNELLYVALIELVTFFRVIEFIREIDPRRFVVFVVFRQMHVGHEVHHIESQSCAHFRLR